jgi:hypothetical protein
LFADRWGWHWLWLAYNSPLMDEVTATALIEPNCAGRASVGAQKAAKIRLPQMRLTGE